MADFIKEESINRPDKDIIEIRFFVETSEHNFYHTNINCLPVGQRPPISTNDYSKAISIIRALWLGIDIGVITLLKLTEDLNFLYESIDGGHRKRAILEYYLNKFKVNGLFFKDLSPAKKKEFLDIKLSLTIYEGINNATKGRIFRTLNNTTPVNFMEMANSFGDIPIANYIRETVREVTGIDNSYHELFECWNTDKGVSYRFMSFDNDRLKQEHIFARFVYRYMKHPDNLLGGTEDKEIQALYESNVSQEEIALCHKKIMEHLDFLRKIADKRKKKNNGKGLSQHDFKALSYLYFHLKDTIGDFNIDDYQEFFNSYWTANGNLLDDSPKAKYTKDIHVASGYSVQVMYKKYIAAPQTTFKVIEAITYLIKEMEQDIKELVIPKDSKRNFSRQQKENKLATQGGICYIDGKDLDLQDAHAAHIVAHSKGGRTTSDNFVMVRAEHNTNMGTVDLNTYKENFQKAA